MTCHWAGQHTVAGVPVVKNAVAKHPQASREGGTTKSVVIGTRLFWFRRADIVSLANPWASAPNDLFNGLIWPKDG
jgi:hypothetical protein